ncbi:hypothetical protein L7F22_003291 [Adiantum nelumboides]|nr:hypothetical protein [Adiantum nelumboides]
MLPAFTESAIHQASSIMYEVTQDLMNLISKDVAGQGYYTQINISSYTKDVALDMIGRAGFGHDLGTSSKKATEMNTLFLDILKMFTTPSLYCFLRFRFSWICHLGKHFSAEEIKIRKYQKENKIYSDTLVKTAEQEMKKGTAEEDRNFLRFIKRASSNGASSIITDEELRESVPLLLLAGLETSATTLSWAIHALTRGADGIEKQERLRSELCASEFQGWQTDFSVLNRMPYLDAVCTEVLRLHPAFGIISRVCWQDTVIPLSEPVILRDGTTTNKITIKKGEHLHISTLSINRCTSTWGENANEFIPERWLRDDHIYFDPNLSSSNNSSLGGWNHHLSFGQGTRMCLGFRFALAEIKIILAYCIANFDWKQAIDPKTGKPFEIEQRGQKIIFASIKGAKEDDFSLPVLVREIK